MPKERRIRLNIITFAKIKAVLVGSKLIFSLPHNEYVHCNENPIDVFLFWELHGLRPNFHIHVSVSDLYFPRIGPHISCSRVVRLIVGLYKSLTDT
jgi:hypothetical protein